MIPRFRAWINDGEHSRMVKPDQAVMTAIKNCYGGYGVVEGTTGYHYVDTATRPEKYILMQSTGLKDKNGVEIFEGDIVIHEEGEYSYTGSVQKDKYYFYIDGVSVNDSFSFDDVSDTYTGEADLKVVGNAWENPELLEQANES